MSDNIKAYIVTLFEPTSGHEEENLYQSIQCICGIEHITRLSVVDSMGYIHVSDPDELDDAE